MTVMTGPNQHAVQSDPVLDDLGRALAEYERAFPGSEASLYRAHPGGVHVRIFDDRLAGREIFERHRAVWQFIESRVADASMAEVYMLVSLARSELNEPFYKANNDEFEDPQEYWK